MLGKWGLIFIKTGFYLYKILGYLKGEILMSEEGQVYVLKHIFNSMRLRFSPQIKHMTDLKWYLIFFCKNRT